MTVLASDSNPVATTIPTLSFGAPGPDRITVDLARLLVSRLVISGSSNAGKSWALRYLLEQTQQLVQQFVVDPEGEFASLRESHPYLLVGRQGELPAVPSQAHVLARRLMALGSSAVLDLSDLPLPQRHQFVAGFTRGLLDLPQAEWHSVLVVVDEVQLFAPETGRGDSVALAPLADLATLGRKRGECLVIATNRLANVHNNLLAVMLNRLVGQTVLNADVNKAMQDLGFSGREQRKLIRNLQPGQFIAQGPAISVEPVLVWTGMVHTTHPRPGSPTPPAPPAPAAIRALATQLQDLQTASADDLDLEGARARIAELEQQVHSVHAERNGEQSSDSAQLRGAWERSLEQYDEARRDIALLRGQLRDAEQRIQQMELGRDKRLEAISRWRDALAPVVEAMSMIANEAPAQAAAAEDRQAGDQLLAEPAPARVNGQAAPQESLQDLALSQKRILGALVRLTDLGLAEVPKPTLGALSGYASTGGYFRNMVSSMHTRGLLRYVGDAVAITADGRGSARLLGVEPATFTSLSDLHTAWFNLLDGGQRKLLQPLIAAYPAPMTRDELGAAAGLDPEGGYFRNMLGSLRTLKLVTPSRRGDSRVAATPLLFPPALASR